MSWLLNVAKLRLLNVTKTRLLNALSVVVCVSFQTVSFVWIHAHK